MPACCTIHPSQINALITPKVPISQNTTNTFTSTTTTTNTTTSANNITRQHSTSQHLPYTTSNSANEINLSDRYFRYPYTELLQWTLLTRRLNMAKFLVLAGEESIAKVSSHVVIMFTASCIFINE
ncbi:unnamed protein product [Trichobilharzia regenti]|nr:unnamed protein product [Trichobilharzia regenti]